MKFRLIMMLAVSLIMASCGGGEKQPKALDITGQWELTDIIETKSAQIGSETIEVYIYFKEDNTFAMWQKLGEGRHRKYEGTWTLTESVLTGKYSDGKAWGASYEVSREEGTLTMSEQKAGIQTYIYNSCTIPSSLK
jgi:hypothetical protein